MRKGRKASEEAGMRRRSLFAGVALLFFGEEARSLWGAPYFVFLTVVGFLLWLGSSVELISLGGKRQLSDQGLRFTGWTSLGALALVPQKYLQ